MIEQVSEDSIDNSEQLPTELPLQKPNRTDDSAVVLERKDNKSVTHFRESQALPDLGEGLGFTVAEQAIPAPPPPSLPQDPHHYRNIYRAKWGKLGGIESGLVAPENHLQQASDGCPILSAQGRFFKFQGMLGKSITALSYEDMEQMDDRLLHMVVMAPLLPLQCLGILAGSMYGSHLDRSVAEKKTERPIPTLQAPYTDLTLQIAAERADAFNPCGTESDIGINSSFCSPITAPRGETIYGAICIDPKGYLTSPELCLGQEIVRENADSECECCLAVGCILFSVTLRVTECAVSSPCILLSCLGFASGIYDGAPVAPQQPAEAAEVNPDLGPTTQQMR